MEPTAPTHSRGYYVTRTAARMTTLTALVAAVMVGPFAAVAAICKGLGL